MLPDSRSWHRLLIRNYLLYLYGQFTIPCSWLNFVSGTGSMKILVTGGAGFIGSHLTEALLGLGHEVTVLDNLSTGRLQNLQHLDNPAGLQVVVGDVMEIPLLDKLVERCEAIFHLAAAVGVELIVRNPWESLTSNIRTTELVLQMAYRYNRRVLLTSSSEIYGKNTNVPLKEDDDRILGSPAKSRWGYSTSKAVGEMLAYYYWKEKGLPTVITRLFNTVGPRQTGAYGMVIPRFVSQALRGESLTVHGDGRQTRCFIHVKDTVRALIGLMLHPGAAGEVYNLGSQEEVTIRDLAALINELAGNSAGIHFVTYEEAYEPGFEDMPRRVPDITKINRLIGFQPAYSLHEVLLDVLQHSRANPAS